MGREGGREEKVVPASESCSHSSRPVLARPHLWHVCSFASQIPPQAVPQEGQTPPPLPPSLPPSSPPAQVPADSSRGGHRRATVEEKGEPQG